MEILEINTEEITNELVKNNVTDKVIKSLREKYLPLTINGIDDKEGFAKVRAARIECKNLRVLTKKITKKGREQAILVQRTWLDKEKEVVGKISEVEDHLQAEEDKINAEKERIRLEKERKEQERVQNRINQLAKYGVSVDYNELKLMSDDSFDELLNESKSDFEAEQVKKAEEERKRKEEQERLDAERKRQEELERVLAEKEAALKAERDKIEAEKKAIEEAKKKEEEEKKRLAEIEKAKKEAAEKARIEAAEKIKREAAEKAEKERLAKIEAERQAALKPDKEKLYFLAETIERIVLPEVSKKEAVNALNEAKSHLLKACETLRNIK